MSAGKEQVFLVNNRFRQSRVKDMLAYAAIYICTGITVMILIGIIFYILVRGIGQISPEFLTSVTSVLHGTVGIAGNIVNTLYIVLLSMVIATPVGIGAAIYLNEYAKPGRLVAVIEFATETLSGIPSIIYGLFGMLFFGQTLGLGYSLITGSFTLILMVLPLITRNTQEALKTVPDSYRQGAIGLGAGKWHMIRTVLLPSAVPGIMTGIVLSVGRIISESAALLFTAGSAKKVAESIFSSGGSLTVQLYLSATSEGDFDTAFGIAVVLIVLVLVINQATKILAKKLDNTHSGT